MATAEEPKWRNPCSECIRKEKAGEET
ncbi:hypothetical protein R3I94_011052 [Phoxinus phoxinus]